MLNSYGLCGFQWLIPKHQNLVNSLISAVAAISDAFAIVAVGLHSYGLRLQSFLLGLSVLTVAAAAVSAVTLPTLADTVAFQEAALCAGGQLSEQRKGQAGLC